MAVYSLVHVNSTAFAKKYYCYVKVVYLLNVAFGLFFMKIEH